MSLTHSNVEVNTAAIGDVAQRVSLVEAKQNAVPTPAATTPTVVAAASSAGLSFTPVAETALGLTQDGAWHTVSVAGVPSGAKMLLLLFDETYTAIVANNIFQVSTNHVSANIYTGAFRNSAIGANSIQEQKVVLVPVGGTFDYLISNGAFWTVLVSIQGYWS